jgi:hypothetical protein
MAVNFADAWKSHILQDFQFPQEYPQPAMKAGTPQFASQPPCLRSNEEVTSRLTP